MNCICISWRWRQWLWVALVDSTTKFSSSSQGQRTTSNAAYSWQLRCSRGISVQKVSRNCSFIHTLIHWSIVIVSGWHHACDAGLACQALVDRPKEECNMIPLPLQYWLTQLLYSFHIFTALLTKFYICRWLLCYYPLELCQEQAARC